MLCGVLVVLSVMAVVAAAQKDKKDDEVPTANLNFLILKEENGKPVRNAAVILHTVNSRGEQEKGGMELKTDLDGKAIYEGVTYGKLRVQVLASGFQTWGEDFDINKDTAITIKLQRPKKQFSVYDDQPKDSNPPAKPPDPAKPN
jgi:hypothetical protein